MWGRHWVDGHRAPHPCSSYPGPVSDATLATPGALMSAALRQRGLTLDDLAQSTRLRRGLLEQMLDDDFLDTGGDVYARGHLRTIAGVLGIDADQVVAAYDDAPAVRRPPAP
jgi:cytoskeleton protein RodZ